MGIQWSMEWNLWSYWGVAQGSEGGRELGREGGEGVKDREREGTSDKVTDMPGSHVS